VSDALEKPQRKEDPFEHYQKFCLTGNTIYEPIIYGNANKDYWYCYRIMQMKTIQNVF
jgi:hypothetical protein